MRQLVDSNCSSSTTTLFRLVAAAQTSPAITPRRTLTIATGLADPVVVILGATGTGKSKLSIDVGSRFPAEVVNSDKIQVYKGYDITTNKITPAERRGVPHHLLGELDPADGEISPAEFRTLAAGRIATIGSNGRLPVVAGGSNSYVHALLAKNYDPSCDHPPPTPKCGDLDLKYRCCMVWVDVQWDVLEKQLDRRVDEMVGMGMVEELAAHYDQRRPDSQDYKAIDKAIGIPEFDNFFKRYPPPAGGKLGYQTPIQQIKDNTRVLAKRQIGKIERLRDVFGWEIKRLDATEAVRRKVEGREKEAVEEAWERDVMLPALLQIAKFINAAGGLSLSRSRSQSRSQKWCRNQLAGSHRRFSS